MKGQISKLQRTRTALCVRREAVEAISTGVAGLRAAEKAGAHRDAARPEHRIDAHVARHELGAQVGVALGVLVAVTFQNL